MKQQFYSHLVSTDHIFIEIDNLDISEKEKIHLKSLVTSNIHIAVLDIVMTHIPPEDKKMFLNHLHKNEHEAMWEFLEKRTIAIDKKIIKKVKELSDEFLSDIHQVKST